MMPSNKRFTNRVTRSVQEIKALTFTHGPRSGHTKRIRLCISSYGPTNPVSKSSLSIQTLISAKYMTWNQMQIFYVIKCTGTFVTCMHCKGFLET